MRVPTIYVWIKNKKKIGIPLHFPDLLYKNGVQGGILVKIMSDNCRDVIMRHCDVNNDSRGYTFH